MLWLTSLPSGLLVAGCLAGALLVAIAARFTIRAVLPAADHDQAQRIASPLMPTLGAAFGVLIGLTLASEAGYLKAAEDLVAAEAAAGSRLAWAATSPGVRSEPIHTALLDYLQATRAAEWEGEASSDVAATLAHLEQVVRTESARPQLGTPASTELLASLDALTSLRRQRLASASRRLPTLYVLTLLAAATALTTNAAALTARTARRTTILTATIASTVALTFALLLSLTAPYQGPLTVTPDPLDHLIQDLQSSLFTAP